MAAWPTIAPVASPWSYLSPASIRGLCDYCSRRYRAIEPLPTACTVPLRTTLFLPQHHHFRPRQITTTRDLDAAVAELRADASFQVATVAGNCGVDRSALSRRVNNGTFSRAEAQKSRRILDNKQEKVLLVYIKRISERCLPPTAIAIRNLAQELCGHMPAKNWVARFSHRHKDKLGTAFMDSIDLSRCQADCRPNYEQYFTRI